MLSFADATRKRFAPEDDGDDESTSPLTPSIERPKRDPFTIQRNASRIAKEQWETHKAAIIHNYRDQDKTLDQVMEVMKMEHGFVATYAQS